MNPGRIFLVLSAAILGGAAGAWIAASSRARAVRLVAVPSDLEDRVRRLESRAADPGLRVDVEALESRIAALETARQGGAGSPASDTVSRVPRSPSEGGARGALPPEIDGASDSPLDRVRRDLPEVMERIQDLHPKEEGGWLPLCEGVAKWDNLGELIRRGEIATDKALRLQEAILSDLRARAEQYLPPEEAALFVQRFPPYMEPATPSNGDPQLPTSVGGK